MRATEFFHHLVGSSGRRVHVAIMLAALAYLGAHAAAAVELLATEMPFVELLLGLTLLTALGNVFLAVPLWVYSLAVLLRGPRPLVTLPPPVSDEALPRIVVQIPGRHEPLFQIMRSVDSVLEADYPPDKLSVQFVDNSDDERWKAVADRYAGEPRVRVEHRDGTTGFKGGNLNHGLEKLGPVEEPDHTLIGLLDVGDTFAPHVIRPMATELARDPGLGFVQGMFRSGNAHDTIISWSDALVGDAARRFTEGYAAHYGIPTMNGHCALLRLSALEASGRWDQARVAEDWATGIEMIARGWRAKWVDYAPTDPLMVSTELVPGEISAQQKQKRRWATGGAELARFRLGGWLRSKMPWHQRLALVLRLGANLTVVPTLFAQVLWPIWLALAISGEISGELVRFGLVAYLLQNPFFVANGVAALNYLREGRGREAGLVLLAYPVQALWRLPLTVHAFVGFMEGLGSDLKDFVITPKGRVATSSLEVLRSQRLAVGVSLLPSLPLLAVLYSNSGRHGGLVWMSLALPLLTVLALVLVPWTQRLWGAPDEPPHS